MKKYLFLLFTLILCIAGCANEVSDSVINAFLESSASKVTLTMYATDDDFATFDETNYSMFKMYVDLNDFSCGHVDQAEAVNRYVGDLYTELQEYLSDVKLTEVTETLDSDTVMFQVMYNMETIRFYSSGYIETNGSETHLYKVNGLEDVFTVYETAYEHFKSDFED